MPIDPPDVSPCTCSRSRYFLAPEEEQVLRRMRALREEAGALREVLAAPREGADSPQRTAARQRLTALREAFADCKRELELANQLKMRRLGHIR